MILAAIDTGALLKVVWFSLLAGLVITAAYSLGVYGMARYAEARHDGTPAGALTYAVLGAIGYAAFVVAVVAGVLVMTSK
jgi:hypothetical protein